MTSKANPVLPEDRWSAYSHALGIVLALLGSVLFFQKRLEDTPFLFGSIVIYCVSLVVLFSASTLCHSVQNPALKKKLRIADHISIYYLIAGTYTSICLTVLLNSKGWLLLYGVWGIALFGTVLKLLFTGKYKVFSLVLYAVMGWCIVMDWSYVVQNLSATGLFYLILGGALYTLGLLFYAIKKIPFHHFIWHLLILGGATSHWMLIFTEIMQ